MLDNSPKDPTTTISLGLDTSDPISMRYIGYCVEIYTWRAEEALQRF
jgi:hypothetical protein